MKTDAELIDDLGGTRAVAEALFPHEDGDAAIARVKKWRQRRIPLIHRHKVRALASKRRYPLPESWIWQVAA